MDEVISLKEANINSNMKSVPPKPATAVKKPAAVTAVQTIQSIKQRPASAKVIAAQQPTATMSTTKSLGKVVQSKESDMGIHMTQILNYYRSRVEAFEKDRVQWYEKLQNIRPKQDLVHRVEWELKKRQEEKAELERTMQEMQSTLFNERERIVQIKQQTDMLRIKGKENRQLIIQLLENNNAVEQHVYYQKDQQPEKIQSYSKQSLMKPAVKSGMSTGGLSLRKTIEDHKQNPSIHYDSNTPNVLRTIYMPNDQSQQMRSEVEQLHQQIQEQRIHYEGILGKLRDDRSQYEENWRERYLSVVEDIERTLQGLQDQEIFNYQVVRDHVELMAQFEAEERKMQEETESIRVENAQLRDQIRDISKQADSKKKEVKHEYEKSVQEYSEKFRHQSRLQKENIAIIKDQYKKVQEIYRKKMEDMQEKLAKETKKMEIAERRRKLELEGYSADLSAMKKKIQFFQKYIAKMKKAVEEERDGGANQELLDMSEMEEEERRMDENERVSERSREEEEILNGMDQMDQYQR